MASDDSFTPMVTTTQEIGLTGSGQAMVSSLTNPAVFMKDSGNIVSSWASDKRTEGAYNEDKRILNKTYI